MNDHTPINHGMTTSQNGIDFIKNYDNFHVDARLIEGVDVYTIGYGDRDLTQCGIKCMQNIILLIIFLIILTPKAIFADQTVAKARYQIFCTTSQPNPTIYYNTEYETSYDYKKFRLWYSLWLEMFRPVEIIIASDGQQLFRGHVFDFRGRKSYLQNKKTYQASYDFFVPAEEWDCSLQDNHITTGE